MELKYALPIIFALTIIGVYLYVSPNTVPEKKSTDIVSEMYARYSKQISQCVYLCAKAYEERRDLRNGPCLSELYPQYWNFTDWVCDVAHWPRQDIDNTPSYMCSSFGKTAHNFIEVNPDCEPIRIYIKGVTEKPVVIYIPDNSSKA